MNETSYPQLLWRVEMTVFVRSSVHTVLQIYAMSKSRHFMSNYGWGYLCSFPGPTTWKDAGCGVNFRLRRSYRKHEYIRTFSYWFNYGTWKIRTIVPGLHIDVIKHRISYGSLIWNGMARYVCEWKMLGNIDTHEPSVYFSNDVSFPYWKGYTLAMYQCVDIG